MEPGIDKIFKTCKNPSSSPKAKEYGFKQKTSLADTKEGCLIRHFYPPCCTIIALARSLIEMKCNLRMIQISGSLMPRGA